MFYRKHARVTAPHSDQVVTKQSHKAECDIHNILRQYQRTGILTHVARAQPLFDELPDQIDFQGALHQVMAAQEAFAALPSKVREQFRNDPAMLLAALQDPSRRDEFEALGILKARAAAPAAAEADNNQGAT